MYMGRLGARALVALALLLFHHAASASYAPRRPQGEEEENTSPATWLTQSSSSSSSSLRGKSGDDEDPLPLPPALLSATDGDEDDGAAARPPPRPLPPALAAAVRRLLPPTPTAARSLLAEDYTLLPYAYYVATVTPRENGTAGTCPSAGAQGSEGQRLAALFARSFRADPRYSKVALKPLQCWVKPGLFDQVALDSNAPWHAYWVFEARNFPSSQALGIERIFGDHTFYIQTDDGVPYAPRNSSCFVASGKKGARGIPDGAITVPLPRALKDGLWNGAESGVDCGMPCKSKKCGLGEGCSTAKDCVATADGCDSSNLGDPQIDPSDGTVALGGVGTCAQKCSTYTGAGLCPAGTVADARYADDFCDIDTANGGVCSGTTYAPTGGTEYTCCSNTSPCSSITTCDSATQYPDPNLDNRCSNAACSGPGDNAKCCLQRAQCSSLFSASACTAADANSVYKPSAYCAAGKCDATKDKAVCCPPRALCSAGFSSDSCRANDPQGAGPASSISYTVSSTARCADVSCVLTGGGVDWPTCCKAQAICSAGYFGTGGFTCPTNSVKNPTNNCAGRTCAASDFTSCCTPLTSRTCQAWQAANANGCSSYGGFNTVNTSTTTCYFNALTAGANGATATNCLVLCCNTPSQSGNLQTCDQLKISQAGFCSPASFASPSVYAQCSLIVNGSCNEACCSS